MPVRHYAKKVGESTREVILKKANEIINRTGVVDFRIEALATALNLSPGNITYHFPKKDDIISAIWQNYLSEIEVMAEEVVTPLLDIKQLFLLCRNLSVKTLSYVGVVVHYYGDIGVLIRDNEFYNAQVQTARTSLFAVYNVLAINGLMRPIEDPILKELTLEAQLMPLRWWINHAMLKGDMDSAASRLDNYMAVSIYPLTPYLTPEGRSQFDSILKVIKSL